MKRTFTVDIPEDLEIAYKKLIKDHVEIGGDILDFHPWDEWIDEAMQHTVYNLVEKFVKPKFSWENYNNKEQKETITEGFKILSKSEVEAIMKERDSKMWIKVGKDGDCFEGDEEHWADCFFSNVNEPDIRDFCNKQFNGEPLEIIYKEGCENMFTGEVIENLEGGFTVRHNK